MRNNFVFYPYFENHLPSMAPPTLLTICNTYCNSDSDKPRIKILDLSKNSRSMIFDFTYPLSSYINEEEFEEMFIDHFLDRRIGQETFTAFKLHLRSKIREIMPEYNALFDAIGEKLDILAGDGYTKTFIEREDELTGNKTGSESSGSADRRFSDTPQGRLDNVREGAYLTDYTYTQDNNRIDSISDTERGKDRNYTEIQTGKKALLEQLLNLKRERLKIYEMIYHDCDELFWQLF